MMAPPKNTSPCMVDECQSRATARGYCNAHYQKWLRWGRPEGLTYLEMAKVRIERHISPEPNSGCWLWTGHAAQSGHGIIIFKGKKRGAHRVSWIAHNGQVNDDAFICHKCDVPSCVNPSHLYVGNAKTNSRDMVERGQSPCGERGGRAKITWAQASAIRKDSRHLKEIAKDYPITPTAISYIKNGKTWKERS